MHSDDDNNRDQRAESGAPHVSVNNSATGGVSIDIYTDRGGVTVRGQGEG